MDRFSRFLDSAEEMIMATMLGFMTLLTFVQVVMRYVFNAGWVWSLEATTYSFATMIMVGMAYGVRTQSHIAVDLVTSRLPAEARRYVALIALFFCLVYAGLMFYGSAVFVSRLYALGNMARDLPAPKWLLTAVMPFGFALLSYRLFEAAWNVIKNNTGFEMSSNEEVDLAAFSIDDEKNDKEEKQNPVDKDEGVKK